MSSGNWGRGPNLGLGCPSRARARLLLPQSGRRPGPEDASACRSGLEPGGPRSRTRPHHGYWERIPRRPREQELGWGWEWGGSAGIAGAFCVGARGRSAPRHENAGLEGSRAPTGPTGGLRPPAEPTLLAPRPGRLKACPESPESVLLHRVCRVCRSFLSNLLAASVSPSAALQARPGSLEWEGPLLGPHPACATADRL